MDIERTMEFILQSQAKAEVRAERADAQIAATANLVREGMKIVGALIKDRRELRKEMRDGMADLRKEMRDGMADLRKDLSELAKAQARTEATLDRYLKSLGNGHHPGNGHSTGKKR